MKSFKNRSIDFNKKVKVYRNLNNEKLSVQQDNLVIGHCLNIALTDCSFIVREGGRDRVRAEKRKNVHAFVEGFVDESNTIDINAQYVTYNPYKYDKFVAIQKDGNYYEVSQAKKVLITTTGVFAEKLDKAS